VTIIPSTHWRRREDDPRHITLICPQFTCGRRITIAHAVSAVGCVSPTLRCPDEACGFADDVTLEGWTHGEKPRASP